MTHQTRELYRVEQLPVFQNRMYDTALEARNCPKGDIHLVEDRVTGLVYNLAFRPELMVYDNRYQNEQAVSPLFHQHLESVATLIEKSMGRDRLVEVGCGKGYFFEMLVAKGFDVTGFDPAYEGNNPRIQRKYFAPGAIDEAEGLILRHVLEHIHNPYDFLRLLSDANDCRGKIYIEVPCFDWICRHRAWFDIFYEHVNYFRLSDFNRLFGQVIDSGRLFGGQYLYVTAELSSLRSPKIDVDDTVEIPHDFARGIAEPLSKGQNGSAIWGGASKGVIFALLKERAGSPVTQVIDINPAKQGKYLAGTGLRVQSPAEALAELPQGSTIYVMNPNYLKEIQQMSHHAYHYVTINHD